MTIRMSSAERPVQDRIGNAVYRLTVLERRAAAAAVSPKLAARFADDVKKLTRDMEACYQDARALLAECSRLREAEHSARKRASFYFDRSPTPTLIVDPGGAILEANAAAVRMLNVSRRHLAGRAFQLYVGSEREQFLERIHQLHPAQGTVHWEGTIRPRERSAIDVHLALALDPDGQVLVSIHSRDAKNRAAWSRPSDPDAEAVFVA